MSQRRPEALSRRSRRRLFTRSSPFRLSSVFVSLVSFLSSSTTSSSSSLPRLVTPCRPLSARFAHPLVKFSRIPLRLVSRAQRGIMQPRDALWISLTRHPCDVVDNTRTMLCAMIPKLTDRVSGDVPTSSRREDYSSAPITLFISDRSVACRRRHRKKCCLIHYKNER